jgi:hypothetical protein
MARRRSSSTTGRPVSAKRAGSPFALMNGIQATPLPTRALAGFAGQRPNRDYMKNRNW